MADFVKVHIDGLDDLEERIQRLSHKAARQVMQDALEAAGQVYLAAELARAPVMDSRWATASAASFGTTARNGGSTNASAKRYPGQLRDSLTVKTTLSESKESGTVEVGPGKDGWYGKFSEFGTSHEPARPWMRPAFDSCAQQVQETFTTKLAAGIDQAFADMGAPKE